MTDRFAVRAMRLSRLWRALGERAEHCTGIARDGEAPDDEEAR